jgi:monoamine oxidase
MPNKPQQTDPQRRRLLQLGAYALGGAMLGGPAAWAKTMAALPEDARRWDFQRTPDAHHDVVVIGAGISGLTAAWDLKRRGRNNVLVLEARDRVGGRTLNAPSAGGGYVELGGQWVGPTQDAVLGLMARLGIGKFKTYNIGRTVNDTSETLSALELLDYWQAVRRIDNLSKTISLTDPWSSSNAQQWDQMTVRDWMNQNMATDGAKDLIDLTVQIDFGGPARSISFLWFLF